MGIAFEVRRQSAVLDAGEKVLQETRGWNEQKESSFAMRLKEAENDYRYFPCPDLVPMQFTKEYVEGLRANLPELPLAKFMRYQNDFGLSDYDANLLTSDVAWAKWFEEAIEKGGEPKAICNWMNSEFAKLINEQGIAARQSKITPEHLVELTKLIADGTISGKIAKSIFADSYKTGKMPSDLVKESGSTQITDDSAIKPIIESVLAKHADVVEKYKSGQVSVRGFLVGQIMRESQGRANPQTVNKLLDELLQ